MNPRLILYGAENRKRLLYGAQMFARTVCVTYGPQGRNAVLDRAVGLLVTKDGVTVAREIDLPDPVANLACQSLKDACIKVNDRAGDGTTTAACIAAAILTESIKLVTAGHNPVLMARGIQLAAQAAADAVWDELARPIETQEQLEKVALIASNGDAEVAANMAEAVMAVGKKGTVSIEDGNGVETVLIFKEGMEIDRGVSSMHFLKGQQERVLEGPIVAVIAATLSTVEDVLDLCEEATTFGGRPLVVFCENIQGEALKTMVMNDSSTDHNYEFIAIVAPATSTGRKSTSATSPHSPGRIWWTLRRGWAGRSGTRSGSADCGPSGRRPRSPRWLPTTRPPSASKNASRRSGRSTNTPPANLTPTDSTRDWQCWKAGSASCRSGRTPRSS